MNLDLAAEYLVMAAWLAYLKSRLLLPKDNESVDPSAAEMAEALQFQLRRLEAMLAVADKDTSLIITGNGDVLEPENGIVTIGSGGAYAQAAALALLNHTEMGAADIVKRSLEIAGELCIYTNMQHTIETL